MARKTKRASISPMGWLYLFLLVVSALAIAWVSSDFWGLDP
jgi:hypothetical protein